MSNLATISNLHRWHHDDYDEAKQQIHQSLGSIADIEVFGRQVLVAVYIRPNKSGMIYQTVKAQAEDIYQGKAALILKCGPGAFKGEQSYLNTMFGHMPPPEPGDWVFVRPSDGFAISLCGDNAKRPRGKTFHDEEVDLFEWDGWPCRILSDDSLIGRMNKPHTLV